MLCTASRTARIGAAGMRPICSSHAGRPSPIPGQNRPGNIASIVEKSSAWIEACRVTADWMPSPTGMDSVAASAAVAAITPLVYQRSSVSQTSPNPFRSASAASPGMSVGGMWLPISRPTGAFISQSPVVVAALRRWARWW